MRDANDLLKSRQSGNANAEAFGINAATVRAQTLITGPFKVLKQ
jgi:hypothetical protein